jgi:hypothetical protein
VDIRSHTPSFEQFTENMSRVAHFFNICRDTNQHLKAELEKLGIDPPQHRGVSQMNQEELECQLKDIRRFKQEFAEWEEREASIVEWVPVMLVTFTEAYLQEMLAYVAAIDDSLMSKSEQSAKYADVLQAQSIAELANDLRRRWAKGIVDDGGPRKWVKKLPQILQFPAEKYPSDLAENMEVLWGVRHVVVHAAAFATPDFVRRHPQFGVSVGERIRVTSDQAGRWLKTAAEFVRATDEPVVARTASYVIRREE